MLIVDEARGKIFCAPIVMEAFGNLVVAVADQEHFINYHRLPIRCINLGIAMFPNLGEAYQLPITPRPVLCA